MSNAPRFDHPGRFRANRIRLTDVDGSGITDIIYLGSSATTYWLNQAGNGWSEPHKLPFPIADDLATVEAIDLLGKGTSCLVWSSPLASLSRRRLRYVDLMPEGKPHLLRKITNNLGAETHIEYAPSTEDYLADRDSPACETNGPWLTKVPFPVHVVRSLRYRDLISNGELLTRYRYRHGFYDTHEREFRGFAYVEQTDAETFAAPPQSGLPPVPHAAPVLTKSWFHTGAYLHHRCLERSLSSEYFQGDPHAKLLPDTLLPDGLCVKSAREAARALRNRPLRIEIYAHDESGDAAIPYQVTEQNHAVRLLQDIGSNRYRVFDVHPSETLTFDYERSLWSSPEGLPTYDPRTTHGLVLEVDAFTNVTRMASVAYGRREPDTSGFLTPEEQAIQARTLVQYTETDHTAFDATHPGYRLPLPCDTRTYEVHGLAPSAPAPFPTFRVADFKPVLTGGRVCPRIGHHDKTEQAPSSARLLQRVVTLFWDDPISGPLPLGQMGARALPHERYELAFDQHPFQGLECQPDDLQPPEITSKDLAALGYCQVDWESGQERPPEPGQFLWAPSGHQVFDPTQYYQPTVSIDPFGNRSEQTFDPYKLRPETATDAVGNETRIIHDYRVLQPQRLIDPNQNHSAVSFDALGMVVSLAEMGKVPVSEDGRFLDESSQTGDHLPTMPSTISDEAFFQDPATLSVEALGPATACYRYDLHAFRRGQPHQATPMVAAAILRQHHRCQTLPLAEHSKSHCAAPLVAKESFPRPHQVELALVYSDGFGREAQIKDMRHTRHCKPLPAPRKELPDTLWAATGWTQYNNKGNPVRSYEPFFSRSHAYSNAEAFETQCRDTVSTLTLYDPLDRAIATLHPDGTYEKTVFDAWTQFLWDRNDTCLLDARKDLDLDIPGDEALHAEIGKSWFLRHTESLAKVQNIPLDLDAPTRFQHLHAIYGRKPHETSKPLPTIHDADADCAFKTASHADTPFRQILDAKGRTLLEIADNGKRADGSRHFLHTRTEHDLENQRLRVIDPVGRDAMRWDYDLRGSQLRERSIDAGHRWMLSTVDGQPGLTWDAADCRLRYTYDAARRPLRTLRFWPQAGNQGDEAEVIVAERSYGDAPDLPIPPEQAVLRNLRDQLYEERGSATDPFRRIHARFDHAGNPATTFQDNGLEAGHLCIQRIFDAEDRPIHQTYGLTASDQLADLPSQELQKIVTRGYDASGNLCTVSEHRSSKGGSGREIPLVRTTRHNARDQRTRIHMGNGATTVFRFDPLTFRLQRQTTFRKEDEGTRHHLLTYVYTFDPAANVSRVQSKHDPISRRQEEADARQDFHYDPTYRLIQATGREHDTPPGSKSPGETWKRHLTAKGDPRDKYAVRRYREHYRYDDAANLVEMRHRTDNGYGQWTREIVPEEDSNRIARVRQGYGVHAETEYHYTPTGCMQTLPFRNGHLEWNHEQRLVGVQVNGKKERRASNTFDLEGQRSLQMTSKYAGSSVSRTRAYLEEFWIDVEITRRGNRVGASVHISEEGDYRLLSLHHKDDDAAERDKTRYAVTDQLGSEVITLDPSAVIISHEEFGPYGNTSFRVVDGKPKDQSFGFTGQEADKITGFTYHHERFYAPALGMWCSPDPIGIEGDNVNVFVYGLNNPGSAEDPDGLFSWKDGLSTTLDMIPVVSTLKSVVELATGEDPITGAPIDRAQAGLGLAASFIPGGGALKTVAKVVKTADKAYGTYQIGKAGVETVKDLSTVLKSRKSLPGQSLEAVTGLTISLLTKKRRPARARPKNKNSLKVSGPEKSGDVPASTPVGRRSSPGVFGADAPHGSGAGRHRPQLANGKHQPHQNLMGKVNGREYSGHAFDQMRNRGLTPRVVENAIKTGAKGRGNRPGTFLIHDKVNNVKVILNDAGRVITAE